MSLVSENIASELSNPLSISWHDSAWIPILNANNVLDYFCEKSNPFYDRTCNNESVKMQGLDPATHLKNMTGIEYVLIHSQEPILYVIRKQHRHRINTANPNQLNQLIKSADHGASPSYVMGTTPLTDYYIIAGVVYQSPDLSTVLHTRLLSSLYHCQSAFGQFLHHVTTRNNSNNKNVPKSGLSSQQENGGNETFENEQSRKDTVLFKTETDGFTQENLDGFDTKRSLNELRIDDNINVNVDNANKYNSLLWLNDENYYLTTNQAPDQNSASEKTGPKMENDMEKRNFSSGFQKPLTYTPNNALFGKDETWIDSMALAEMSVAHTARVDLIIRDLVGKFFPSQQNQTFLELPTATTIESINVSNPNSQTFTTTVISTSSSVHETTMSMAKTTISDKL